MRILSIAAILAAATVSSTFAQTAVNQAAAANPTQGPQMHLEPAGLATLTVGERKIPMGFIGASPAGVVYSDFNHTTYVVMKGDKVADTFHIAGGKL